MSLLDLLVGNGKKDKRDELKPVMRRLDDIDEVLQAISVKTDDNFDSILRGIDTVMPHEKGQFINRIEEKIMKAKRDMVHEAILAECVRDAKSYSELRHGIRDRTGLNVSGAFLDSCVKRLAYEGRLDRVGNRFICGGSIRNAANPAPVKIVEKGEEAEFITEIMGENGPENGNGGNGHNGTRKESKFTRLDSLLKLVGELESGKGSVPVDTVISESQKLGFSKDDAAQLIDEHLMITGQLYEPKQGHLRTVKPSLTA